MAEAVAATLGVEELDGAAGLAAVAPEWADLCDRCPWTTPFQRPEWLLPWCRRFGPREPWVLAVRREGRLVGLAPLFVWERKRPDGGRERAVAFLGAGVSDHLDVLADPACASEVIAALFAHLGSRAGRWDVCELEQLRPGSPLREAPAPAGWRDEAEPQDTCPVLPLPASVEALAEVVPAGQLKSLGYSRRRIARLGETGLARAEEEGVGELLGALFRLHGARWRERGEPGVLDDPGLQAFHREVAAGFAARGALLLLGLRLDGALAAVIYGFYEKDCAFFYLHGFDPGRERLSPGVLIVGAAIEEAVRRGLRAFDFLRGREAYKYRWGAEDRTSVRRRLRHGAR